MHYWIIYILIFMSLLSPLVSSSACRRGETWIRRQAKTFVFYCCLHHTSVIRIRIGNRIFNRYTLITFADVMMKYHLFKNMLVKQLINHFHRLRLELISCGWEITFHKTSVHNYLFMSSNLVITVSKMGLILPTRGISYNPDKVDYSATISPCLMHTTGMIDEFFSMIGGRVL